MHPIDDLEDRCDQMLNLVPYFDGRCIREQSAWQSRILPDLQNFLRDAAKQIDTVRLILDTHVSVAFAAGAKLNVKSGRHVELEQRTDGRHLWSRDDAVVDRSWPSLVFQEEQLTGSHREITIAISLTHDVSPAVRSYIHAHWSGMPSFIAHHLGAPPRIPFAAARTPGP